MIDEEKHIITTIWNDLVLRKKLENNPYSLSRSELTSLESNDYLNEQLCYVQAPSTVEQSIIVE
jgi:hypothetical protein